VTAEDEQITVAGEDDLGAGGNGAGDDVIVVGIVDCGGHMRWRHGERRLRVFGDGLVKFLSLGGESRRGEDSNALVACLACVSRKLERPLTPVPQQADCSPLPWF